MSFDDAIYEVLEQRKYNELMGRRSFFEEFIGRLGEFALKWFADNFQNSKSAFNTDLFFTVLLIITAILAAAAVVWVVIVIKRRFSGKTTFPDGVRPRVKSTEDVLSVNAVMSDGRQRAERGDFRGAVRCGHTAALLALGDKKLITLDNAKTDRHLGRELERAAPGHVSRFKSVVDTFSGVWFGHKNVKIENFYGYMENIDALIREVGDDD
jgi:hypothetical protein